MHQAGVRPRPRPIIKLTEIRERLPSNCNPSVPPVLERPVFGSSVVAPFGAVGLDTDPPREPSPDATVPVAAAARGPLAAARSADGKRDIYQLSPSEPVPLVGSLGHHLVDDRHLWIAVEDGKVIVADDTDHELMHALIDGCSPIEAAARASRVTGLDSAVAWETTLKFLGRLAAAGFVQGIHGYHTVKKIRPQSFARFHLTHRCQLECVHCYVASSPYVSGEGELPVERWRQLVDDFADNGGEKVLFTGGEALVYRGCIDIMRRAHERGLEVTLFSNGILIPRYIDQLVQVADIVQISVDGPNAETHDAIRGPGSFKKAMRAIHLLLAAEIEARVSTTIMMNNWSAVKSGLPGFFAQFKDTKLSFRVSYGAMAHGRGANLDHSLDPDEVRRFVDNLLSQVRSTEDRETGPNVIQKISGCGYAEQLVVAPDGFVYPCHLMSGALGHIDDLPLSQITRYLTRTAEAFSVNHRQGCRSCDLRNLCGGSCRVEDEKHTGSRLVTTCTPEDKLRKKRFLIRRYSPV